MILKQQFKNFITKFLLSKKIAWNSSIFKKKTLIFTEVTSLSLTTILLTKKCSISADPFLISTKQKDFHVFSMKKTHGSKMILTIDIIGSIKSSWSISRFNMRLASKFWICLQLLLIKEKTSLMLGSKKNVLPHLERSTTYQEVQSTQQKLTNLMQIYKNLSLLNILIQDSLLYWVLLCTKVSKWKLMENTSQFNLSITLLSWILGMLSLKFLITDSKQQDIEYLTLDLNDIHAHSSFVQSFQLWLVTTLLNQEDYFVKTLSTKKEKSKMEFKLIFFHMESFFAKS